MLTLYWFLVAVMIVGVFGTLIPAVPGTGLVVAAIAVWGFVHGFGGVSVALSVAIGMLLLSFVVDLAASYWGAKRFGASRWGQIGAVVGLIVGVLGLLPALPIGGPLLGIFVGPFLGAITGEFLHRKDFKVAVKAGVGVVVGSLVGNLIQGVLALAAVVVFILTTWPLTSA